MAASSRKDGAGRPGGTNLPPGGEHVHYHFLEELMCAYWVPVGEGREP